MTDFVHPALLFILGALPIPFLKGASRKAYLLLIPVLAILAVLMMQPGSLRRGVSSSGRKSSSPGWTS